MIVESPDRVEILPDTKLAWINGLPILFLTVVVTTGFGFAALLGWVDGLTVVAVGILGLLGSVGHSLWAAVYWRFFPGRTRYYCDGRVLEARRGKRVKSVLCADIVSVGLTERATLADLIWSWPIMSWPELYVHLKNGGGEEGFARILLWGDREADRAEDALAAVAGVPVAGR